MKTLYIVRHAKSSWDFAELPDVERPLTEKGIYNTKKILAELNNENISLDMLICSHAKRAFETAKLFASGFNYPVENIVISKGIYQVDRDDIFNVIFGVKDDIDSLMIVGHNPTLTQFSNLFLEEKIDLFPTSGIISINFEADSWNDIIKAPHKINFTIFAHHSHMNII